MRKKRQTIKSVSDCVVALDMLVDPSELIEIKSSLNRTDRHLFKFTEEDDEMIHRACISAAKFMATFGQGSNPDKIGIRDHDAYL